MTPREEAYKLAIEYRQTVQGFLTSGELDDLFSFIQDNPMLVRIVGISASAKDKLRRALQHQQADADAYRSIVKLAHDAGVPLFPDHPKV